MLVTGSMGDTNDERRAERQEEGKLASPVGKQNGQQRANVMGGERAT